MKRAIVAVLFFIGAVTAQSQITGSILSEFQLGNLPDMEPNNLRTLYNQAEIGFRKSGLSGELRFESFGASVKDRGYNHLPQRYLQYERGPFKVRAGNFFKTFGRGLILRGFELPNVIFEQRHFRRRYAYYRDFDGVLLEGNWHRFEVSLLRGNALNNVFPPELEGFERRMGDVTGAQVRLRPTGWLMLGDAYLKTELDRRPVSEFNSFFSEISFRSLFRKAGLKRTNLEIYGEHARENSHMSDFFSVDKKDPHASYLAVTLSHKRFGLSAEYKDYQGFENSVNVPPILYMEHGYYLLNRNSKELLSDYERGYQFEATYRPTDFLYVLANASFARNDLGFDQFDFAERFVDVTAYISPTLTAKAFYDWAKDEIKTETDRKSGGVNLEWEFIPQYAVTLDLQHQSIVRSFGTFYREELVNSYWSTTFSKSPDFSLALAVDRSTDPIETDNPDTFELVENDPKYWTNIVASYRLNMSHEVSLFYGSRRGGLVCVSGTCFEVLPFEGLEIRWTGHF